MRTVYIDDNNMCHAKPSDEYTAVQHPFFDDVCDNAIEQYRYIPSHNFIQCVDRKVADAYQKQYNEDSKDIDELLLIIGGANDE